MNDEHAKLLASLSGLADKTERAERKIMDKASRRIDAINARLETLRGTIEIRGESEYLALVKERGELSRVIAMAQKNLA